MSEVEITAPSLVQMNWQKHLPVQNHLREILEPLADDFIDTTKSTLDGLTTDELSNKLEQTTNLYHLPFGRTSMLPPALFGEIDTETITQTRDLVVPTDRYQRSIMATEYMEWAYGIASQQPWASIPSRETVVVKMDQLQGESVPIVRWHMAACAVQDALRQEPTFTIDVNFSNRMTNAGFDYDELDDDARAMHRQHESYLVGLSRIPAEDHMVSATRDCIQLPIGEYGEAAAAKLVRSTVLLNDLIKTDQTIDSQLRSRLTARDFEVLRLHTARGRERYQMNNPDYAASGVKNTLTEGLLSVAQAISFLTAEKVPGYDNYDDLVVDILGSQLIEQFTRSIRPGYIGPATLAGLYMPGVLEHRNGKLAISKSALETFSNARREYLRETAAQWVVHHSGVMANERPSTLGTTCPAATPKGALTTTKSALRAIYRSDPTNT